jgi:hypothetical protein
MVKKKRTVGLTGEPNQTWRYWKKPAQFRDKQLLMKVNEPQHNFYIIEKHGVGYQIDVPKGEYNIEIVKHPNPTHSGDWKKRWICFKFGGNSVGVSLNFIKAQARKGEVSFSVRRNSGETLSEDVSQPITAISSA